jgi:molybdenum cofactor cytidylyltransferase
MISAIVLAAGKSSRMGRSKMTLSWGHTTVIGKVINTLLDAGLSDLHVISGRNSKELEEVLKGFPIEFVYNPDFGNGEMISSVQSGIKSLQRKSDAALIVLGDQPQIEVQVVQQIIMSYFSTGSKIIVPSFQMHRGHPWLLDQSLWNEILDLKPTDTLRDFLHLHQDRIEYINVNTASIIQDLDTPEDYERYNA